MSYQRKCPCSDMKAKTKTEKAVVRLSGQLKPIGDRDKERAKRLFRQIGYDRGRHTVCLECGSEFKTIYGVQVKCPVCGKTIEIEHSLKRKYHDLKYYSLLTIRGGFQVERVMVVEKDWRRGSAPCYDFNEVYQVWTNEKGVQLYMTLPHSCNWYYFHWDYGATLRLTRYHDIASQGTSHGYRVWRILPVLRRNGFTGDFQDCNSAVLFKMLLRERWFETLWKIGLGQEAFKRPAQFKEWFKQVVYCQKTGYKIGDYSMWFDMLCMMKRLQAPTHCGQHLCPANLKQAHDMWQNRVHRLEMQKRREERMRRLEEDEKLYAETHGMFVGVFFEYKGIQYHVLENVREFIAEGDAMDHCVYDMSYFNKTDSVILGVRDEQGKRLATIELDRGTWKILQCKGRHNLVPPKCRTIKDGVHANINILKRASRRKLKKTA